MGQQIGSRFHRGGVFAVNAVPAVHMVGMEKQRTPSSRRGRFAVNAVPAVHMVGMEKQRTPSSRRGRFAVNVGSAVHMVGMKKQRAPSIRPKCADMPEITEIVSKAHVGSEGSVGFSNSELGGEVRKSSRGTGWGKPPKPTEPPLAKLTVSCHFTPTMSRETTRWCSVRRQDQQLPRKETSS